MFSLRTRYLLPLIVVLVFAACKKGELLPEYYFGNVAVEIKGVPDKPAIEVRFEGKKVGLIAADASIGSVSVPAGESGVLGFYKANTDSLVADTMLTIQKNGNVSLRLLYSDALGIKGFITTSSKTYSQDSIYFQLGDNLSMKNYPSDYEAIVYVLNNDTYNIDSTAYATTIKKGTLATELVIPVNDSQGRPSFYAVKIKDLKTGNFLMLDPDGGLDFFALAIDAGRPIIVAMTDSENGYVNYLPVTL